MKIVIVTGISGAGKSHAVDILEDFGYYCVDNLPLQAVALFADLCSDADIEKIALVTDIRGGVFNNQDLKPLIQLQKAHPDVKILYLDCQDDDLILRFQETRRRHPLLKDSLDLEGAIQEERKWLAPLRAASDTIIDTSGMKITALREEIEAFLEDDKQKMQIQVIAFGFKYGLPRSADFSFDARFLPNPFYDPALRKLTGLDQPVRDFVMSHEAAQRYLRQIEELIEDVIPLYESVGKYQITVAFGCTGGQHRSVTFAYLLEEYFRQKGYLTSLSTRDIEKDRTRR